MIVLTGIPGPVTVMPLSVAEKSAVADVMFFEAEVVCPSVMARAVDDSTGWANVSVAAVEVASAAWEIVTAVVLERAVIVVPGLIPLPVTILPTSAAWKFAVADVTAVDALVVCPFATVLLVAFSILRTPTVVDAVAAADMTAAVALVTDLMNAPSGMPVPLMPRLTSTNALKNPVALVTVAEPAVTWPSAAVTRAAPGCHTAPPAVPLAGAKS
jgi:hypothetical protein